MITRRIFFGALGTIPLARLEAGRRIRPDAGSRYLAGPCASATSKIDIAAANEPGKRMIVKGQVFKPDGRTPSAGVIVYVYHTDETGEYRADATGSPKLKGWMKTDKEGRYEYRTIRPGAYPSRNQAAHVHVQFWSADVPPQWNYDLLFDDDPLVGERDRRLSADVGRFAFVSKPQSREGVLHVSLDYKLEARRGRFRRQHHARPESVPYDLASVRK